MDRKTIKVFIGRKRELDLLNIVSSRDKASLVIIKGRRRVGKSRLVAEFAKDKLFLPFAGLAPVEGVSAQDQHDAFANYLSFMFNIPPFSFDDWSHGFAHLEKHLTNKPTVILFDEISWMGHKDPTFLPKLKNWWDRISEIKQNLTLVLCGSVSTWIEENIIKSTAFFGRISLNITLNQFNLAESYQLLRSLNIKSSDYDLFKLLSITGGVPWYIENINHQDSIDENIKRLCFSSEGLLVNEFNSIFHDLFERKGDIYKKIISLLANGMRDYSQIRESLNYSEGGGLYPYLDALITSGYVTKHQSWSIGTGKSGKKSLFRLSDNYLRFYLKVIEPQLDKINRLGFENIPLSSIPGINSILGIQIENLLLSDRNRLLKSIGINPHDVLVDNPFLQKKTKTHAGVQIDYLVQTQTNTLYLCEFKFSRNEIGSDVIGQIKNKMDNLYIPKRFSIVPVLFHFSGVSDSVVDSSFFYRIVDINNFLQCTD